MHNHVFYTLLLLTNFSFIDTFTSTFQITENDCLGNQAPFDFDVSVKDIYSALKTGAMLVIVPKEYFSQPALLLDYLDDYKVTTLIWAVSALCLLSSFHGLDYKKPKNINQEAYKTVKFLMTILALTLIVIMVYFIATQGIQAFLDWWTGKWFALFFVVFVIGGSIALLLFDVIKTMKKVSDDE